MGSALAPITGTTGQSGWSQSTPLLAGDPGTSQTIDLIRKAVWQGLSDARVRAQLAQILRGVPAYDTQAELQAIYAWVRKNIRFTNDPVGHETVSTASWTITHGIGDCDDINAVLIPTLVMTAGIPARLVTVSNDPSDPSRFSHVYAEAESNGRWIPLDAARPGAKFGTTVRQFGRKRLWSLVDRKYQDLAGLNGVTLRQAGMGFDWDVFGNVFQKVGGAVSTVLSPILRPTSLPQYQPAGQPPPPPVLAPVATEISPMVLLVALGLGAALLLKGK